MTISPHVGILAIQGDVAAHARALQRAGAQTCEVRTEKDLDRLDALVLPGGESTTISKGMARLGLYGPLRERIRAGMPVLGTCAGAIVLAREVTNPAQKGLGLIDVAIERNAYGRQVDSFVAEVPCPALGAAMPAVFIRAPRIRRTGPGVEVVGRLAEEPVLVREGNVVAATFHPELTPDRRLHAMLFSKAGAERRSA